MQMDLKNNHHYIYKDYLNKWALDGKKKGVFYLSKKRVVARDSAAALFVERHFYNFPPIENEDLFFFQKLISTFADYHQESSFAMVREFCKLSELHRFLSGKKKRNDIARAIQVIEKNTLEDRHSAVENAARPVLKKLWLGEFDVLESKKNCALFAYFLACQALRNKGPKMEALKRFSSFEYPDQELANKLNVLWVKYWNIIVSLISENMGLNVYFDLCKGKYEFLRSVDGSKFITSDRPVNNIHPDEMEKNTPPDKLDLYFPLSPTVAFHFPESLTGARVVRDLSSKEVDDLNVKVAKSSFGVIVATSKSEIEMYKKFVPVQR